jgi:alpha-mannosidase II
MAYIEDKITRLSILSAQPLGGISPKEGVLDIFQDRRLLQDDNRGLGQGVTDNRKTRLHFKIMFEIKPLNNLKPTLKASQTLYQLLHPPLSFLSREVQTNDLNFLNQDLPCDHHLLSMRSSLRTNEIFVTLHRFGVSCGTGCDVNSGFNFDELLSSKVTERLEKTMSRKTLTALYDLKSNISMKEMLYIDQMDLATYSLWPKK